MATISSDDEVRSYIAVYKAMHTIVERTRLWDRIEATFAITDCAAALVISTKVDPACALGRIQVATLLEMACEDRHMMPLIKERLQAAIQVLNPP